jgi:hypothetical protein
MAFTHSNKLIRFLQEDLAMALKKIEQNPGPLPMILWQYGLVTIDQLDRIYDWMETA